MRDVLRRYKPNTVEDLTALNALYRPGPIQGGMIDDFIERKHGRKKVEYELPELEEILRETLGVIVYQEQVMQIANGLPATRWAKPTCCAAPWARRMPRRWPSSASASSSGATERGFKQKQDREDLRPDGAVRRIRLQQVALGRLRAARLSDRLSQDALSRSSSWPRC